MTDSFRKDKQELTEHQLERVTRIKEKAEELLSLFNSDGVNNVLSENEVDLRSIAVAKTQLETSVMWAVKGYTKSELKNEN